MKSEWASVDDTSFFVYAPSACQYSWDRRIIPNLGLPDIDCLQAHSQQVRLVTMSSVTCLVPGPADYELPM